ncbi:MAG: AAA family ATPase [Candidatus Electrothrix communis]|nr:MAG: AAA family ATPase [Candidatus Electrothrix communis]
MKNNTLINLHEELLHFLLNYRNESKYRDTPNFLFRPASDEKVLNKGRWFYDNPESGWVNIYFAQGNKHKHFINNVQFGINTSGGWNIGMHLHSQSTAANQFWNNLIQSFANVVERHNPNIFPESCHTQQINLYPIDRNFRSGIPEALDILFQFLKKELADTDNIPLSLIKEELFQESLQRINAYRSQQKIKRVYLNGFQIENFQGIKNAQLNDFPKNPSWVFLTGENGFGKTCFLKALAIGLYGDREDIIIPQNKESKITVNYTKDYHPDRVIQVINNIDQPLFFRSLQALAAYGPSRLEIQAQDSHKQQAKNSTATYNLFHTDGVLKNIEAELLISHYDAPTKFAELGTMLQTLIPSLDKIELDKEQRKILYYEKAGAEQKQNENFDPVEYEHLASGIKSIVAMVGDIYLRLWDTQHKKGINLSKTIRPEEKDTDITYAPKELFGIVLIDELDLHLHPKWQRELPSLLSKVFPNVQFIASTHSPIPLLGAPLHSVFLKVDRSIEKGIEVERLTALEKNISNLLPNSILTSPIFDVEHLFPITHDNDEPIETADHYHTVAEKNALAEELQRLARNFTFPETGEKKRDDEKG